jgi:DNA polymerase/3'-5' exonuclease PolX
MELYGPEGKKMKKKDKEVFYYPPSGKKLIKVPGMFDAAADVKNFAQFCLSISHPDVTSTEFEQAWSSALSRNDMVIEAMETLKRENESSGDVWKSRAYAKAVKSLKALKIPIVSGPQVMKIPGIGKGIASHIDEILKTGKLKSQEERLESSIQRQAVIEKFMSIWGVGSKTANVWYAKGHRDIEDLAAEKLTEQQKVGIKYIEDIKEKIPRAEAEEIFDKVKKVIIKLYPKSKVEMVGSYRRGAEILGDIDIIVSTSGKEELEKIINSLRDVEIITDAPSLGDEKFMGIALRSEGPNEIHRRIDIRLVPIDEWGTALLHSTGPDTFNIQLRQQASQLGYKLSEKGLFRLSVQDDGDELIPTRTEADVFKELGIDFVEPEKRS